MSSPPSAPAPALSYALSSAPILSTPTPSLLFNTTATSSLSAPASTDASLVYTYEISRTIAAIRTNRWRRVALQFPDAMLSDAPRVVELLQERLRGHGGSREDADAAAKSESELDVKNRHARTSDDVSRVELGLQSSTVESSSPAAQADFAVSRQSHHKILPSAIQESFSSNRIPSTSPTKFANSAPTDLPRLFILADTAYGACCVDEVAAAHIDADAIIHYGRACLSPTARLPVLHIFTRRPLDVGRAVATFENACHGAEATVEGSEGRRAAKVLVVADVVYAAAVKKVVLEMRRRGWSGVRGTKVRRNVGGVVPNRVVVRERGEETEEVDHGEHEGEDEEDEDKQGNEAAGRLEADEETDAEKGIDDEDEKVWSDGNAKTWTIFHIGLPPKALLLTLAARVADIWIYDADADAAAATTTTTTTTTTTNPTPTLQSVRKTTDAALRRRYALVATVAAAPIIGILVNTLSVADYLPVLARLRRQIARAGRKSYTVVVGKVNAAKVANFAEMAAWVVVGCWESSLIEGNGDGSDRAGKIEAFWRPVVTPWELELALKGEGRVWTGAWLSDFQSLLAAKEVGELSNEQGASFEGLAAAAAAVEGSSTAQTRTSDSMDSDDESSPPEFDLRTGRYVSHSRFLRTKEQQQLQQQDWTTENNQNETSTSASTVLARRAKGDLARVGPVVSPGAEYLRAQRTWQGLGSDFEIRYERDEKQEGAAIEEGRDGIARGYRQAGETRVT